MGVLRFGLQIPSFTYPGVTDAELFETIAAIANAAERSGFDALFVMDHFYQIAMVGPKTDPMLEAYTLLGAIAARTSRIRLGTLVTGVTYRNPALLAKTVTTLDIVSAGRAICGIGAAWNEEEHRGYGFSFPSVKERMERLEEALEICRAMFSGKTPTFEGRHYRTEEAINLPGPVARNGIPILVGGGGEQRTLRLVARYADACNLFGDLDTIRHKLEVLERHCEAIGRDPATITKTRLGALVIAQRAQEAEQRVRELARARGMDEARLSSYAIYGDPERVVDEVGRYLEAGLDGMVFNTYRPQDLEYVELMGSTLTRAFG